MSRQRPGMRPAGGRGRRRPALVALLALLGGEGVGATAVTVTAAARTGAAASDAVVVFEPLEGAAPATHDTATVDQINKRFVPRVTVIRTGTAVTFPNSDHIRHQVYSFSPAKTFDLKLYAGSPKVDVVFDKPGLVVLGCNIHDTMVGFVLVVDTPYFAKIPPAGRITLELPAGRYRLRAWHEQLAGTPPARAVEVGQSPQSIALTLDLDAARDTAAPWP